MEDRSGDVFYDAGGFLVVKIDHMGHIRRWGRYPDYPALDEREGFNTTVHRETRDLHLLDECHQSFVEAKRYLPINEELCILELSQEGGGMKVWMREDQKPLLMPRLGYHSACYGHWPVFTLNGEQLL